jgi:hypothetical protein
MPSLADLDELVLLCRTAEARRYIEEAVKCYSAGAFRSAIVAAWIAVAYDFIAKLRELDLAGDKKAKKTITEFEKIRSVNDLKGALDFERTLLDVAKDDYELLSLLEHKDLQRLFEDRNRCAHPSMNSLDETYQPTAELARYHIRNAVSHFLQHPPLQGKAALDRLIKEVNSPFFPTDVSDAEKLFQEGPLRRPRDVLVRNFVVVLIKKYIENEPPGSGPRKRAALGAVSNLHRAIVEETVKTKLSEIVANTPDDKLTRVIALIRALPECWEAIGTAGQIRVQKYIAAIPKDQIPIALPIALTSVSLKPYALKRLAGLLEEYQNAKNWNDANAKAEVLKLLIPFMGPEEAAAIVSAGANNSEVKDSFGFPDLMATVRASGIFAPEKLDKLLEESGLRATSR